MNMISPEIKLKESQTTPFLDLVQEAVENLGWEEPYQRMVLSRIERFAAPLLDIPIGKLTPDHVIAVVDAVWNKPAKITAQHIRKNEKPTMKPTAKELFRELKMILTYGIAFDIVDPKKFDLQKLDAKRKIKLKAKHTKHHRPTVRYTRLPKVARVLMVWARNGDQVAACVLPLMLTGCRLREVTEALWSEIDTEQKVFRIDADRLKMRLPHHVPLSPEAIEILSLIPSQEGQLFTVKLYSDKVRDCLRKACKEAHAGNEEALAACEAMVTHGLRSCFRKYLQENHRTMDTDAMEEALSHSNMGAVVEAYNRDGEQFEPIFYKDRLEPTLAWSRYLLKD